MRHVVLLLLTGLYFCDSAALAGSPEERAATVAPFIDDQTFAVAHVDLTNIETELLMQQVRDWTSQSRAALEPILRHFEESVERLRQTGASSFFAVFSVHDVPGRAPLILVPLTDGLDEAALRQLVESVGMTVDKKNSVLYFSYPETIDRIKDLEPHARNELATAFQSTRPSALQLLLLPTSMHRRIVEQMIPNFPDAIGGGPTTAVTRGLEWCSISFDLPPNMAVNVVVQSPDAASAARLNEVWNRARHQFFQQPRVQQNYQNWKELTQVLALDVKGDQLVLQLAASDKRTVEIVSVMQKLVEDRMLQALRMLSFNKLKQIALAMHNYHDAHKSFPPAASVSSEGKPLLSWRVHILPFIEEVELYKKFRLDEPWDSEHNKQLIDQMPEVLRSPLQSPEDRSRSAFMVPVGNGSMFTPGKTISFRDITDGTSNTMMTVEVEPSRAVIWTKPSDFEFKPQDPTAGIGRPYRNGFCVAIADGSAHFLPFDMPANKLKAIMTASGGEVVDW